MAELASHPNPRQEPINRMQIHEELVGGDLITDDVTNNKKSRLTNITGMGARLCTVLLTVAPPIIDCG